MSRLGSIRSIGHRLYAGEVEYDFVGRQKRWYLISAVILVLAVVGLLGPGIKKGIEFTGGSVFTVDKASSTGPAHHAIAPYQGEHDPIIQKTGNGQIRVQIGTVTQEKSNEIKSALGQAYHVPADSVNSQVIGPSWGHEISKKALQGLIIFMILVIIYLAFAFEWRMAVAAVVGLIHDIVITVGVYALVGFEVTPGTVIGLLTILGYSLYDNVVVFDSVKQNTKGITKQTRYTYSEAANRGLNQSLIRSINTTVVALLPVAALLFIGGGMLGAGDLEDIALSLFIGLAAGAYSSIFIATPLLADLKEREPQMKALAARVKQRRAAEARNEAKARAQAEADAKGDEGADGEFDSAESDAVPAQGGEPAAAGATRTRTRSGTRNTRSRPSGKRKR